MSAVTLHRLEKSYDGEARVVAGVDLSIEAGEFVVFVGPSGSGKSTLLRMIAGLESASAGEIRIGELLANDVHASRRGIAMVFQSYALYPHMTVYDNMAFALRMAGQPKAEVAQRVRRSAEILQITHLLDRKPKALSGGQRQRVAIGRAIVREPRVFLFDEPLSNLDASLRQTMRVELAKLHRELGATMIYVTHDQVEAMTLADRIVVFDGGVVQQVGTPAALYENPANLFVAGFLGAPKINLVGGTLHSLADGSAQVDLPALGRMQLAADVTRARRGDPVTLGVRPEHLRVAHAGDRNVASARVELVEYLGDHLLAYLGVAGAREPLCMKLSGPTRTPRAGDVVPVCMRPEHCLVFDSTGRAFARPRVMP
ncbi:MAG TPA: ABC transporter ATP-binding protein [Albitalea sp.]|uniref:ABC transporter ATP-binding protein n=1 Tax=Piscinibacter sp. TaxID=1903157 RepID=UPI002ECFC15D